MKTIVLILAGTVLFLTMPIWAPLYCLARGTSMKKACHESL